MLYGTLSDYHSVYINTSLITLPGIKAIEWINEWPTKAVLSQHRLSKVLKRLTEPLTVQYHLSQLDNNKKYNLTPDHIKWLISISMYDIKLHFSTRFFRIYQSSFLIDVRMNRYLLGKLLLCYRWYDVMYFLNCRKLWKITRIKQIVF